MNTEDWYGCYDNRWRRSDFAKGAISHPAKMARNLLLRLMTEGVKRRWWGTQSLIIDPFAGIGSTGIMASSFGIKTLLVELEERWVKVMLDTIELHRAYWEALNLPIPTVVQGDSRKLSELVNLDAKSELASISSPPFGYPDKKVSWQQGSISEFANRAAYTTAVATDPRNIALLSGITSPPYGNRVDDHGTEPKAESMDCGGRRRGGGYGSTEGNIGSLHGEQESYWEACTTVYRQLYDMFPVGGIFCCVVKAFVRKHNIIDVPQITLDILRNIGWQDEAWINTWQVARYSQSSMLSDVPEYRKQMKGFFRLNNEKKGAPRIDNEVILVVRK